MVPVGHNLLPGSVSQPVAEDSENVAATLEPLPPVTRTPSVTWGRESNTDEPKELRRPSRSTSGNGSQRRSVPGKSVSVASLISKSNSVHGMEGLEGFSTSNDSLNLDDRSAYGRSTGSFTNDKESAQLAAMMDPAIPNYPPGSPRPLDSSRDSKFTGPLKDIYPDDIIVRPQRQNDVVWDQVMDINEHWQTHAAEDSGEARGRCRANQGVSGPLAR